MLLAADTLRLGAALGLFAFVALIAFLTFSWADERTTARQSLKVLDDYDNDIVSKLRKINRKNQVNISDQLVQLGRKITPSELQKKTREKLNLAGRATKDDMDRFLAARMVGVIAAVAWLLLIMFVMPGLDGTLQLAVAGFGAFGAYSFPTIQVNRLKEERQKAIRRALPDVLDILCISVEAGLGFEQALDQVVEAVPGPLSDEFFRMLSEVRAGANRAEAMRAIDERTQVPELKAFIMSIVQADKFGVSIGNILRSQAEEMRIKRRQLAQEKAQKLPVKMLLPMTLFIFPALLIIVLGPAAITTMTGLQ